MSEVLEEIIDGLVVSRYTVKKVTAGVVVEINNTQGIEVSRYDQDTSAPVPLDLCLSATPRSSIRISTLLILAFCSSGLSPYGTPDHGTGLEIFANPCVSYSRTVAAHQMDFAALVIAMTPLPWLHV